MIQELLHSIQAIFRLDNASKSKKISCYHCGDKSAPERTVYVQFNGVIHPVCCNGCAAILKTVDELGLQEEYFAHKIQITDPDEP